MPVVSAGHELSCFANISTVFMVITLKKCPDEPGELEAMTTECLPWRVMQGLQRNVIGMAFCCKKSVGTSERQLGDESGTDKVTQQLHGHYGLPRS